MIRAIAAGVAGWILFAGAAAALFGLSGRDPHAPQDALFAVASTVYGVAFAAAGGAVAGALGGRRGALALAALIAAGATVSLVTQPGLWSQLAALLLMAPAAFAGGARMKPRRVETPSAERR